VLSAFSGQRALRNRGLIFGLTVVAARFDRDLDFVVRGMLNREKDPSIGFVGDQPQQFSFLLSCSMMAPARDKKARGRPIVRFFDA
jgi:hypothetical protein